jgi:hypothetical protein
LSVPGIDSWYHEKESAWLYRRVAAAEPDPKKRELFLQLATAAEEQADTWQRVASEGGAQSLPGRVFTPSLRARGGSSSQAFRGALPAHGARGHEGAGSFGLQRAAGHGRTPDADLARGGRRAPPPRLRR